MTDADKKQEALAFLAAHRTGVLATLSPEGTPRARLVYYAHDNQFNIYFMTMANTRKSEDIEKHPQVAFVVAAEDVPQTLQVEGLLQDVSGREVQDPVITELFHNLNSNLKYFAPLARMDRSEIHFFRLTPLWVRWGDFTEGKSTSTVFTDLSGE